MHFVKITLLILFCFIHLTNTAQVKSDSIEHVLIKKNQYFNEAREIIHLHTNKTIYTTDEAIWFKAYIIGHLNHQPFTITKNLYITLYNNLGEKIAHKLCLVNNGFADGNFEIPQNLDTGDYVLMASTAHQENFIEDERFYQKIKIENLSQQLAEKTENKAKKSYDIQILPEGGNLLEGVLNICGIKVINQEGLGVKQVTSELFEQGSYVPISTFGLNRFGMGKFTFTPLPNKSYYIISNIDNTRIKTEVPKPQSRGVLLQSSLHPIKPMLVIELKTNELTLSSIKEKQFHILIHQYKNTKGLTATFKENTTTIKLAIPINDLPFGTNTISLFDENNTPIAERLFFNFSPEKIIPSENIKAIIKEDSIVTSFKLETKQPALGKASISISILPVETISNTNHRSIISSMYLEPFINGYIENPTYYFQNVTKRKKYDLDILLLNQGWSKYDWSNIFRNNIPFTTQHEQGITLKGAINRIMSENDNLLITSPENGFTDLLLPENGVPLRNFVYQNLFLKDSTNLQFLINDNKNKPVNANIKASITSFIPPEFSEKASDINKSYFFDEKQKTNMNTDMTREQLFQSAEQLDEVLLFAKKTPKRKSKTGAVISGRHKSYLDDGERKAQVNLRRYFTSRNFQFIPDPGEPYPYRIIKKTKDKTVKFDFFINGIQTTPFIEKLNGINLENVEEIFIVRNDPAHENSISVYGANINSIPAEQHVSKITVTNGFQPKKTFYTPKYQSYGSLFFKQYGVIGWIHNVKKNKNNEYEFSFLNNLSKEAKVFIEGIDQEGNLISEVKIIQIPSLP